MRWWRSKRKALEQAGAALRPTHRRAASSADLLAWIAREIEGPQFRSHRQQKTAFAHRRLSRTIRLLPALSTTEYNNDFSSGDSAIPHPKGFPTLASVDRLAVARTRGNRKMFDSVNQLREEGNTSVCDHKIERIAQPIYDSPPFTGTRQIAVGNVSYFA